MKLHFFICALCFAICADAVAAEACPKGVDPSYCAIANATGGKVITGTPEEMNRQLQETLEYPSGSPSIPESSSEIVTPVVQSGAHPLYKTVSKMFPFLSFLLLVTAAVCLVKKKYRLLGSVTYGLFLASPQLFHALKNMAWYMRWNAIDASDVIVSLEVAAVATVIVSYVFYKNTKKYVKVIALILSFVWYVASGMLAVGLH
jgi:hypothetical protein